MDGWQALRSDPHEAFSDKMVETVAGAGAAPPLSFNLAPLPARHFCSGHLFWEQQGMEARQCASVHTTFVEGGNEGKLWRFKEAGLWLLDPPAYYSPPDARYLRFVPPQPPPEVAPASNASFAAVMDDKYKAGWLVATAVQMSPRLRAHLELVRRHLLALRDAMAIAVVLNRTLILPRFPCLCDRSEGPLALRDCR
jgi:hypothetical protein